MKKIKILIPKDLEDLEDESYGEDEYIVTYKEDCDRIISIFKDKGYGITLKDAKTLWIIRSDDWSACWLELPESNARLWEDLTKFWVEN